MKHWVPADLMEEGPPALDESRVQILSPFDPRMIQRRRTKLFFDYEHKFEAYVPAAKRVMGYFALPVLMGDAVVAALDLKMDLQADKLLVQKWTWTAKPFAGAKAANEQALGEFETFQRR
ncbi:DNA glycosylase AlkZ-like family protein [Roseateles asaccharophilus]|uniref:Uncharacterized protein YcaQ n=1 Tax=Roseateles asaccharophilus TaxID=582607 RepID=A0ABU2AAT3_9BURK|nr:crosslink repair DNA glycosylase YcaQ family protein [Roseateles asaccharophilus]MDR7334312.1 uncharacterized protein YcaQ [Roseateles asaccharophilus]